MLSLQSANAIELTHRNYTLNAMRQLAWTSWSLPFGFVSEIEIRREVNLFSSNSGVAVLNAQPKVTSEYDETSNAYGMKKYQFQKLYLLAFQPTKNSIQRQRYFLWQAAGKKSVSPSSLVLMIMIESTGAPIWLHGRITSHSQWLHCGLQKYDTSDIFNFNVDRFF